MEDILYITEYYDLESRLEFSPAKYIYTNWIGNPIPSAPLGDRLICYIEFLIKNEYACQDMT